MGHQDSCLLCQTLRGVPDAEAVTANIKNTEKALLEAQVFTCMNIISKHSKAGWSIGESQRARAGVPASVDIHFKT